MVFLNGFLPESARTLIQRIKTAPIGPNEEKFIAIYTECSEKNYIGRRYCRLHETRFIHVVRWTGYYICPTKDEEVENALEYRRSEWDEYKRSQPWFNSTRDN